MRHRNLCPGFGLPVAGSPGTPFFPFFPFFSFFFLFWPSKMEKSKAAAASGRGGAESNCGVVLLLLVLLVSFFFFYFGRRKWRNPEQLRCRGEEELLLRWSRIVGEEEDHPTQNDVVLGWCDFFLKSKHSKTTSFWGYYFFKIRTPKTTSF